MAHLPSAVCYRVLPSPPQLIGPLLMLAIAWATLPDLDHYRNGVIMVGLARCIAMVLIWSQLARRDPENCAILVAINSVLQIVLYAPLALLFLVVISRQYTGEREALTLNHWDVCRSVFLFLGVPLVAAVLTRVLLLAIAGHEWFEPRFVPIISPVTLLALLWTVFAIFAIQGHHIIEHIGSVCRVAVPKVIYFVVMFSTSLALCRHFQFGYEKAITQAFTASSDNFESSPSPWRRAPSGWTVRRRWLQPSVLWSRCLSCSPWSMWRCGSSLVWHGLFDLLPLQRRSVGQRTTGVSSQRGADGVTE